MQSMKQNIPDDVYQIRKDLIDALRSGKYQQTREMFYCNNKYSATGLAIYLWHESMFDGGYKHIPLIDIQHDYQMPLNELDYLNDEKKMSFNQIADSLVERKFLSELDYEMEDGYLEYDKEDLEKMDESMEESLQESYHHEVIHA